MATALLIEHTSTAHTSTDYTSNGHTIAGTSRNVANNAARQVVYRRRRVAVAVAIVLAGAGLWTIASMAIGLFTPQAEADLTPSARYELTETHVVQPGETLWAIAAGFDTDGDLRDTVDRIADANGGSAIEAGQRLTIPLSVNK